MSMASEARAEFDPKEIARAAFPTAFRGYDQDAVRRYLSRLASAISRAQQLGMLDAVDTEHDGIHSRESELELEASELRARVDELEDLLRSQPGLDIGVHNPPLVDRDLDEAELIELLGQETARILEQARSAGADIVHRAESESAAIKEQADLDARASIEEADSVLVTARTEAEEARGSAAAEAKRSQARNKTETKRSRELAKTQADELLAEAGRKVDDDLATARSQAGQIVNDSEQLREEVVGDLVRRRRIYQEQLDRMATARDRLAQALALARSELETVSVDIDVPLLTTDELDLGDNGTTSNGEAAADAEEVADLIAHLHVSRPAANVVLGEPRVGEGDLVLADDFVIEDDDFEIVEHDGDDDMADQGLSDTRDGDGLKVEYLALADNSPGGPGEPTDHESISLSGGPDTLTLGDYDPAAAMGHNGSPDGAGDGLGASALERSTGAVGLQTAEVVIDDYELQSTLVMGAAPGTMHRAATRGDLPRATPYGGTLPAAFEGRDISLTRATPGFRRRLKRAVNDDQSDVLDRLRAGRGPITVNELPSAEDQLEGYLAALRPALSDVVRSGSELLNSSEVPPGPVENLCVQVGKHIVECLRRPSVEAIETTTDTDREAILDPVRATYRDFRNTVLPDLIEDALHEAFALGLFTAIESEEPVLWLTDPRLDPDPICEENSAAPPLPKGTLFPSGHVRPLSMPGCRCLAIPTR